jgi:hypothetical protein
MISQTVKDRKSTAHAGGRRTYVAQHLLAGILLLRLGGIRESRPTQKPPETGPNVGQSCHRSEHGNRAGATVSLPLRGPGVRVARTLALTETPGLLAIATDAHRTPGTGMVLCGVDERPFAVAGPAGFEPCPGVVGH